MLYSQGFTSAESVASRIVPLFRQCTEQLSRQSHYDFGLRALKSVLVAAGEMKRRQVVEKVRVRPSSSAHPPPDLHAERGLSDPHRPLPICGPQARLGRLSSVSTPP